ncbi:MAG: DUF1016 N-terminal domain-containing protein [Pirellulales bacterium]
MPLFAGSARAATDRLLADLRALIDAARRQVAQAVNAGLVTLYWHVGRRIRQEILGEQRAAYGEQIVSTLSKQLAAEYGQGFSGRSIFRMIRFAEVFPDERIVSALRTQLSWTHFREIIAGRHGLVSQAATDSACSAGPESAWLGWSCGLWWRLACLRLGGSLALPNRPACPRPPRELVKESSWTYLLTESWRSHDSVNNARTRL